MADFHDKTDNPAAAPAKPKDVAAVSSGKSALRRKVVGRGQTSLSSRSPMILPDTAKSGQPAKFVPASPPPSVPSAADSDTAKAVPVIEAIDPVQPEPIAETASSPVADTPAVPTKRPVGRPRKVAVGASAAVAMKASTKPVPAQRLVAKPSTAKPSPARPVVAKPHPIEPVVKPALAKAPRIKAAAPPATATAAPAGKVAATAAAASRPALRAARIIDSVSTPHATPPSDTSIKDLTMDMSANFNGFQGVMSEAQAKAQAAFEKSSTMMGEAGDFAKGNVEAMVESSKILAEGMQQIGSHLVAEGRTAFESMTGDIKELAAAKSPTDFLKLQSDLVRKNFDGAVAYSSKSSETFLKLMSDAFAPLSGRVSLAVEKARQVAPMGASANIAA